MDYAKIANVYEKSEKNKKKIKTSKFKIKSKVCDLIAIPTTAGSGAEVTENAVIYIDKKKYSVEGGLIKPDKYFFFPQSLIKLNKNIKASSGFDAIAQAIESILSLRADKHSILFAKKSLELSLKNYLYYLKNPSIQNASKMALAANLAGKAISVSKTIAPHAVSYPFTYNYGVSHGHAVSLTLSSFVKFNFKFMKYSNDHQALKKKFSILFKIFNVKNINELDQFLSHLTREASLQNNFSKLGINIKKDVNKIISGVNLQRLSNNPVQLQANDIRSILLNKN